MDAGKENRGVPGRRLCMAALAWLCLCSVIYAGEDDSPPGTLDSLIGEIRQARDIRTAASLYAKARAIDPKNADLYRAYMCKALKCGFPRVAYYAAAELTQLDRRDGQAWSVMAYQNAVRQEYRLALSASVQAADLLPGNSSVLNNLAYLLGWYEGLPIPPKLNDSVAQSLAVQKSNWLKSPLFAKCYNDTLVAAKAYNERLAQCKEKALQTRRQIDTLTNLAKKLNAAAASSASFIDACDARINSLQATLERTLNDPALSDAAKNTQARGIDSQMNILRDRRNRWNATLTEASQRRETLSREIQTATAAGAEAEKKLKEAEVSVFKPLWQPPDVEGVITADAEPSGPTDVSASPATTRSAAVQSASTIESLLDMAKLLIRNGSEEKGRQSLRAIISKHPSSEAAKEAQAVLDNPVAAYHERGPRVAESPAAQPAPTREAKPQAKSPAASPGPQGASGAKNADPEELLQAARLLVRNDQAIAAQSLLQTIMRNHSGTAAAKEAKVLLAGLK